MLNGRYFGTSQLVFGDRLAVGSQTYRFDGQGLLLIGSYAGAAVNVQHLSKQVGSKLILNDISLNIAPGEFVGILGTSGAGKSTFLDAISGIRPATSGLVTIDGIAVEEFMQQSSSIAGYVPQSDIIHFELTVRQAVWFSAQLRLPSGTSQHVLQDCVEAALKRLDLLHLADVKVANISGGQQKRVSIAAEVLARPFILFLDEPSSGLDPATEAKLMEQLRDLANLGCTVICTTHIMENVHSFDSLIILRDGRLIFQGAPAEARKHFEISRFAMLYDRIESRPVEYWLAHYTSERANHITANLTLAEPPSIRPNKPNAFSLLMARQAALIFSDWKAPMILLAQPVVIGVLVSCMADGCGIILFIAHLAAFWFGCSNASQEIVKETDIYRRERLIGLGRLQYLMAKAVFSVLVSLLQAAMLFAALHVGSITIEGDTLLQVVSLAGTTVASVSIGLALSAWVRTMTQATRAVPLILIPQIVLSGYVLPPVTEDGVKRAVSEISPSHASQALMDASFLWKQVFDDSNSRAQANVFPAHRNMAALIGIQKGEIFDDRNVVNDQIKKLVAWTCLGALTAYYGLKRKETE